MSYQQHYQNQRRLLLVKSGKVLLHHCRLQIHRLHESYKRHLEQRNFSIFNTGAIQVTVSKTEFLLVIIMCADHFHGTHLCSSLNFLRNDILETSSQFNSWTFVKPSIVMDCLDAPKVTVNCPPSFRASMSRFCPTVYADPDATEKSRHSFHRQDANCSDSGRVTVTPPDTTVCL